MVSYDVLNKELSNNLKPIYLLYGDEPYLMNMALKKIKKSFDELLLGINYIVLDDSSINNIISDIQMPAFGYDKKLIVVKSSNILNVDGRKKTGSPIEENLATFIEENIDDITESAVIVFLETAASKNLPLYKVIEKYGTISEINELDMNQLINKMISVAQLYKVKLEPNVARYFVENCGTSLEVLINEIRKLIEYRGEGGVITTEDVDLLAIKQIENKIFDLTDKLCDKKIDEAIQILDNLIYEKEPLQVILVQLYNHFKKLYLYSEAVAQNKNIVNALNLKANQVFLVNKYKAQLSKLKVDTVKQVMEKLADLDYESKTGLLDLDIGIRTILCNYCS